MKNVQCQEQASQSRQPSGYDVLSRITLVPFTPQERVAQALLRLHTIDSVANRIRANRGAEKDDLVCRYLLEQKPSLLACICGIGLVDDPLSRLYFRKMGREEYKILRQKAHWYFGQRKHRLLEKK